jgi:hypothetical protein
LLEQQTPMLQYIKARCPAEWFIPDPTELRGVRVFSKLPQCLQQE